MFQLSDWMPICISFGTANEETSHLIASGMGGLNFTISHEIEGMGCQLLDKEAFGINGTALAGRMVRQVVSVNYAAETCRGSRCLQFGGEETMEKIRVLIIHADRLVREALAFFVRSQQARLKLVGSVADWGEIRPNYHLWALSPDVILLCPHASTHDDLGEIHRVCKMYSDAKVLILGLPRSKPVTGGHQGIEDDEANGYFLGEASLENLLNHMLTVVSKKVLAPVTAGGGLLAAGVEMGARRRGQRQAVDLVHLTRREREIIALLEKGLCNKEIAVSLHIEIQTVKNHVHSILEKLRVKGRREVVRYVIENRLLASMG